MHSPAYLGFADGTPAWHVYKHRYIVSLRALCLGLYAEESTNRVCITHTAD